MDKNTRNIIKQLTKRGIIGNSTSRFDESRTFVAYDKSIGLITIIHSCDVVPSRYEYYNDSTFELVLSRNVKWDSTPRFDNDESEGWGIDIVNINNFIFADALINLLVKGVTR